MNTRPAAIAVAATLAGASLVALPPTAQANASTGPVRNVAGASVRVWIPGHDSKIIYQGERAYGVSYAKPRYDNRCVYIYAGSYRLNGKYRWKAGRQYPTKGYHLEFHASAWCNASNKGWVYKLLG